MLGTKISAKMCDHDIHSNKKAKHGGTSYRIADEIRRKIEEDPAILISLFTYIPISRWFDDVALTIAKYLRKMNFIFKRLSVVQGEECPRTIELKQAYYRSVSDIVAEILLFLNETRFNLHKIKYYWYPLKRQNVLLLFRTVEIRIIVLFLQSLFRCCGAYN